MKYFMLSAAMAMTSFSLKAQEKQDATIKIVVEENGKQKVIERRFSDFNKADGELKKFTDSLDLQLNVDGDKKKKIIRMDVNKKAHHGTPMENGVENITIHRLEGGPGPGEKKRVMIIRGKDGETITENLQGPEEFDIKLEGPGKGLMEFRKIHENLLEEGSKTVQGLKITPNKPFNGTMSVKFHAPEKGNVSISVSDVNGKEVANAQLKDFQGDYLGQVDIKKAGAGVYFVRVTQGNDGAVRRVKVD
jgi:hypothetical protein